MYSGRIHAVNMHVVGKGVGMQLGRIHAVSMHVVK